MRKLTNEAIIQALMNQGSVRDAASVLNCTPQCVYQRMRQDDFKQLYARCRDEAVRGAADKLTSRMCWATDCISKIASDNIETDPKTALSAARTMLEMGLRYREATDFIERIEQLESHKPDED